MDPRILDLGTSWRCVVSFTLRPPYPQGWIPRYLLARMLGGPQYRLSRSGEQISLSPTGNLSPLPWQQIREYSVKRNFIIRESP
jgi:hypothetical protein